MRLELIKVSPDRYNINTYKNDVLQSQRFFNRHDKEEYLEFVNRVNREFTRIVEREKSLKQNYEIIKTEYV